METCGPSNPLQNLGKQFGKHSAYQRDDFRPQGPAQDGFRSARQAAPAPEFDQFAAPRQMAGEFAWQSQPEEFMAQHAPPTFGPGQQQDRTAPSWAAQFSQLNIADKGIQAQTQQMGQMQMPAPERAVGGGARHINPAMLGNYFGGFQPATATNHGLSQHPTFMETAATNTNTAAGQDDAFEKAFAAVEQRINVDQHQPEPEVETQAEQAPTTHTSEDLSKVAQSVLETVGNSTASEQIAEKFRRSEFFNLMKKLGNGQATVQDDKVVYSESSKETSIEPEFSGPQIPDVEVKEPEFKENMETTSNPHVNPRAGQQPLEDPFDYIERLKNDNTAFPSPLKYAQELGPEPVRAQDWEEHYEEAVWYGGQQQT